MRPIALLKVLETVVTQTLYPDEILIIDGSSNHETKTVLEQNYFKNLKYYLVSDKERGLTRQRNFGIGNVDKKLDIVCFFLP
jgi:glycosyltransferase involved in cell wall biosynthesis